MIRYLLGRRFHEDHAQRHEGKCPYHDGDDLEDQETGRRHAERIGHRRGEDGDAGNNLAAMRKQPPQRVMSDSLCRTQESGDSEMRQSCFMTRQRRAATNHAPSLTMLAVIEVDRKSVV